MDKTFEEYLNENPILGFSCLTHNQIIILDRIGHEIEYLLDVAIEDGTVSYHEFERVYGMFWLWVLGSFEVIRTMYSARIRFSPDLQIKLKTSKAKFAKIRIPFAKYKYAGRNEDIHGELSVSGVDTERRDICFSIEGEKYWAKVLIAEFRSLVGSIRADDIVAKATKDR